VKVLVGLGNPGAEYAGTRHNVGFDVVERVAKRLKVSLKRKGCAMVARTRRGSDDVILVCPQTYMNCSGDALAELDPGRTFDPGDVLVVVDDLALPPGRMRLRASGSDGGHRGLRSIEERLGTASYPRLRVGVGATPDGADSAERVLERPSAAEQELLDRAVAEAVHGLVAWLDSTPLATLMSRLNRRAEGEEPESPSGGSAESPKCDSPSSPPRGGGDHHRD
jgi:PTH1 family peptidyl-tRNA hydrolase